MLFNKKLIIRIENLERELRAERNARYELEEKIINGAFIDDDKETEPRLSKGVVPKRIPVSKVLRAVLDHLGLEVSYKRETTYVSTKEEKPE